MAAFGFAMVGLSTMLRSSKGASSNLIPSIERKMRVALEEIAGRAKFHIRGTRASNPPELLGVVSGLLRGSIGTDIMEVRTLGSEIVGRVGTKVKYGSPHEFGAGTPKRAFMGPAVEEMRERVIELLGEGFRSALGS